jgi:hypothetical protein
MIYQIWRLSEAGPDNLGLACTNDGLLLGRTPLIERRDTQFVVRNRSEIERLLSRAYMAGPRVDRIMSGLLTVARALNADDQCLARIAAVHLKIPNLQDTIARDAMESEDCLIKYARDEGEDSDDDWNPALHPRTGTPPNPGWFAPTGGATDESSPVQTAQNDDPTQRTDASPTAGREWVRLPPGPKRIDELADFVEWMANAKPEDEQAIRAEIKRYFYDAGDQGSAAALNSALTVLLRPGLTTEDRQRILNSLDVYTRADPAEYARTREWATGAAVAAGGVPPAATGEAGTTPDTTTAGTAAETNTASATANAPSEVWKYGWGKRGIEIHARFSDGSLPPWFRTIDNFTGGTATSLKSIDLNAATYQSTPQLAYRINSYVNTLGNYEGGSASNIEVPASGIKERVLNLIIPKGSMTDSQRATIEAATRRALTANKYPVRIVITEY